MKQRRPSQGQGTRSRRYHSWLFASCIERSSSMGARRRYRCSSLVLHDGSRQGTERWLVEDEVVLLHCFHSIMSHYGKEAKIMKYHCFSLKSCLACPQIHEPMHQLASTVRLDDSNINLSPIVTFSFQMNHMAHDHLLYVPSLVKSKKQPYSYKPSLWISRVHYFHYLISLGLTHVFFAVQKHVQNRHTICDRKK